jgi:hypothetical protein
MPIKRLTAIFVKNVCTKDAYNICLLIITSITVSEFVITYQLKRVCILLPHAVYK